MINKFRKQSIIIIRNKTTDFFFTKNNENNKLFLINYFKNNLQDTNYQIKIMKCYEL